MSTQTKISYILRASTHTDLNTKLPLSEAQYQLVSMTGKQLYATVPLGISTLTNLFMLFILSFLVTTMNEVHPTT